MAVCLLIVGCVPRYPVTHLQKALTTLSSATPALCLQTELAAGDGPGTFTFTPFLTPPIKNDSVPVDH